MWQPVRRKVWERTLDLAFDGRCALEAAPLRPGALTAVRMRESLDRFLFHVRLELDRDGVAERFEMSRRFLSEISLHLGSAEKLALLSSKGARRLSGQVAALDALLDEELFQC